MVKLKRWNGYATLSSGKIGLICQYRRPIALGGGGGPGYAFSAKPAGWCGLTYLPGSVNIRAVVTGRNIYSDQSSMRIRASTGERQAKATIGVSEDDVGNA